MAAFLPMMIRSEHSTASAQEVVAIDFPMVAIGAAAGGLAPIIAFLTHVLPQSGIACVVIQHLDPTQKAMLPQLLQRATSIAVTEITQRAALQPNHIYVIPSDADLGLSKGHFVLSEPLQLRGRRLPINAFFESLAAELRALAVGVTLSGMGSDGTPGHFSGRFAPLTTTSTRRYRRLDNLARQRLPTCFSTKVTSAILAIAQRHERRQHARENPVPRRAIIVPEILASGRAAEPGWRYPVYQRTHGCLAGTGSRQGQLGYPGDGARRLAPARSAARHSRSPNPKVLELEQQLIPARNKIQAVRDAMQTSREELKSANKELTTSKEEMQSLNEALYTVHAELQSKVDDLSLVNSDMKDLLNSTDIATIFLDSELRIRRFAAPATQIYKLIHTDLRRPPSDIVNDQTYPNLETDALEVIRSLVFCERQVETKTGRWYNVRIMPYRTVDNGIDGVVVTFINIAESKLLDAELRLIQSGAGAGEGAQ
ncbi:MULTISPECIES: chemotaxis protein CheB [unclassified Janthinobacterium]|uniref:chemotaxis protein CheB n=1 Tax=unclassified Janthinobacterium TaxID=2610881 RepID=UPI001A26187D|nr:chemotaxis protein CheB [Janthinobacterium sp. CG_23.4]MDH6158741.1 PAS domain-containing protein [Janthinobacterium sp. CG_23.4]